MNDEQWEGLVAVLEGNVPHPLPCGFIVDSPWLPGWYGVEIAEYLASETIWFDANRKVIETFPEMWVLPGFWSEFDMCTEPSVFGARCCQSIQHYPEIGINLYNPGVHTQLAELRSLSDRRLTILGTIPPLDVLARGTPEDVRSAVRLLLEQTPDRSRLILSCAGGMPPGVTTENLQAFLNEMSTQTGCPERVHSK